MKFSRAYCQELEKTRSPYQARELYTNEEGEYFEQELTFLCEDMNCRVRLTPVGIYMARKSKRALHFRTKDEHKTGCGFLAPSDGGGRVRRPSENEDDFKHTDFPTELDLNPPKRKRNPGGGSTVDTDDDDDGSPGGSDGSHAGGGKRKTSTRTRYLDLVVDCFLSGDEESKKGQFTVAGKTKTFERFFKKIQYFGDETGLIYYGAVDDLKLYNDKGVGLRFVEPVWIDKKKYRVRVYVPQEQIDASRRKKSFMNEMRELKKAFDSGEEVLAFFVGAYPVKETIEKKDGTTFDIYGANLTSVDHLSLVFAK